MAAVSADEVIAVGTQSSNGTRAKTLVERWDGTTWGVVSSPNPSPQQFNVLHGVSATPTDGVWAVGTVEKQIGSSLFPELILHWNGRRWAIHPGALVDYSDDLMAVDVVGSHRFAVGARTSESGGDFNHILAEDSCS